MPFGPKGVEAEIAQGVSNPVFLLAGVFMLLAMIRGRLGLSASK